MVPGRQECSLQAVHDSGGTVDGIMLIAPPARQVACLAMAQLYLLYDWQRSCNGPGQQVPPAMKISDKRLEDIASPVTTRQKRLFSMADSITSNSPNWSEPPKCFSLQATFISLP